MELKVEHISKAYKKHQVLKDISFSATDGECIGITGANGCGKTTFLSILTGLEKSDSGKITVNGKKLVLKRGKRNVAVGYVPQINPLPDNMTVKECLKLWCDNKNDYADIIGKYNLEDLENTKVGTLSGGMKRRCAIACAMACKPSVLVMDEPTASLDIEYKRMIHEDMDSFVDDGGLLIMVTHEQEEIDMCTTCYRMQDGVLYLYD